MYVIFTGFRTQLMVESQSSADRSNSQSCYPRFRKLLYMVVWRLFCLGFEPQCLVPFLPHLAA